MKGVGQRRLSSSSPEENPEDCVSSCMCVVTLVRVHVQQHSGRKQQQQQKKKTDQNPSGNVLKLTSCTFPRTFPRTSASDRTPQVFTAPGGI